MYVGFAGGSESKESAFNAGDLGLIPGWGRSSGEGNGNPLQYSCLEKLINRGAWRAMVHGVAKGRTQLSNSHYCYYVHIRMGHGHVTKAFLCHNNEEYKQKGIKK